MTRDDRVARYYDRNTDRFLRFGRSGETYAIHRELWRPGVATPEEASAQINLWIEDWLRKGWEGRGTGTTPPRNPVILDLGCGVGGTLLHLARAFPEAQLHGVTISSRQVEMARSLARRAGLETRCHFLKANFEGLELPVKADVAVAVESFVHASQPARFLGAAARHLRPGGLLLLVDDFLARDREELGRRERATAEAFERGWRLSSLCTPAELQENALREGLVQIASEDFTGWVALGRARDRVIRLLAPAFRTLGLVEIPFFANMIGGDALQTGLQEGFLEYRAVGFRKVESPAGFSKAPPPEATRPSPPEPGGA